MNLFRHLGLMVAFIWCAAMVLVPLVVAADAGYATNQGMNQGTNPAPGSGNTISQQEKTQNNSAPRQENRPQGIGRGNMTEYKNPAAFVPGNSTMTPPEKPAWDSASMTAMNNTAWHSHGAGNITDVPPPMKSDKTNTTAMNSTPWHGNGNMTPPEKPAHGTVPGQGQPQVQNLQETQEQMNSTGDLIAQFLEWLKAHAGS